MEIWSTFITLMLLEPPPYNTFTVAYVVLDWYSFYGQKQLNHSSKYVFFFFLCVPWKTFGTTWRWVTDHRSFGWSKFFLQHITVKINKHTHSHTGTHTTKTHLCTVERVRSGPSVKTQILQFIGSAATPHKALGQIDMCVCVCVRTFQCPVHRHHIVPMGNMTQVSLRYSYCFQECYCMCVCVWERERERECHMTLVRVNSCVRVWREGLHGPESIHTHTHTPTHTHPNTHTHLAASDETTTESCHF